MIRAGLEGISPQVLNTHLGRAVHVPSAMLSAAHRPSGYEQPPPANSQKRRIHGRDKNFSPLADVLQARYSLIVSGLSVVIPINLPDTGSPITSPERPLTLSSPILVHQLYSLGGAVGRSGFVKTILQVRPPSVVL